MATATDHQWLDLVQEVLDRSHLWRPEDLAAVLARATERVGLRTTIYQIDHEQRVLTPLPRPGAPLPASQPVDASIAGRAFGDVRPVPARSPAGARWWVPMVDGTDRLGVIDFLLPEGVPAETAGIRERCVMLAGLVGHLLTTTTPRGDHLHRTRRSQPMTIGAELLWQMLPPLTATLDEVVVSAILEPCYDVGGDGFDYSLDGRRPQLMVLDAAGRGLRAGLACAVVLAAVRSVRRAGGDLHAQAAAADVALAEQFPDARFATAVLVELDLDTGVLRYVNAGHPPPLLLRSGRLVRPLNGGRRLPLGIDRGGTPDYGEEALEPGDRLLVYTDGVTEARAADGERFGVRRLVDLAERHADAGLPAPETLRRLSHAIVHHQQGPPGDDATLLLAEWSPGASRRTVPSPAGADAEMETDTT